MAEWTPDPIDENIWKKLHPFLRKVFFDKFKFKNLSKIQKESLPFFINLTNSSDQFSPFNSDLVLASPTGEGKTLCYLLPIISQLFYLPTLHFVHSLILAPTRELVTQIGNVVANFTSRPSVTFKQPKFSKTEAFVPPPEVPNLRVTLLGVGASFAAEKEELSGSIGLGSRPSEIVVATPARFFEHSLNETNSSKIIRMIQGSGVEKNCWENLQFVIFDEADTLAELPTSQQWLTELNSNAKHARRVVASATMARKDASKFHALAISKNVKIFTGGERLGSRLPSQLRLFSLISRKFELPTLSEEEAKPLNLLYLLHQLYRSLKRKSKPLKCLIFCSNKRTVERVATLINMHFEPEGSGVVPSDTLSLSMKISDGELTCRDSPKLVDAESVPHLKASAFTSNLSQMERASILRSFEGRETPQILVCSNVLSHGVDLASSNQFDLAVIQYDIAESLQTLLHRSGRTGRASRKGFSILLLTKSEKGALRKLLKQSSNQVVELENLKGVDSSDVNNWLNKRHDELSSYYEKLLSNCTNRVPLSH